MNNILTNCPPRWQQYHLNATSLVTLALLVLFIALQPYKAQANTNDTSDNYPAPLMDPEQLALSAEHYLTEQYGSHHNSKEVSVEVRPPDPRLNLSQCPNDVELDLQDRQFRGGRVSVKATCHGEKRWSIYLSATVEVMVSVVVANGDLQRGDRVSAADLRFETMNLTRLNYGHITDMQAAIGKEVRRLIRVNSPVRAASLQEPIAVKRGDSVNLQARTGTITVQTTATALSNGRVGEQIRVRNNRSERVIRVKVLAEGQAEAVL